MASLFRVVYNESQRCYWTFEKEFDLFQPNRNEVNRIDPDLGIYETYVVARNREAAIDLGRTLIENHIYV